MLLLFGLACGGDTIEGDGPLDAGSGPDTGALAPCAIAAPSIEARVGQHVEVSTSGEAVPVRATPPDGGRAEVVDGEVNLVLGYRVGTATVSIEGRCPDGREVQATFTVEVEPLSFSPAVEWGAQTGPAGREYFSTWIDPRSPNRLWLVGGFHYAPRPFTPASDVWSLDLGSGAWTRHPDAPADVLPGGGLAMHPDGYLLRYGGLNQGQLAGAGQLPFVLTRIETSTATGLAFSPEPVVPARDSGDYQPTFFFHPSRGRFFAACGAGASNSSCNLWRFDPQTKAWAPEATAGADPRGRSGHFWVYDEATDRLVIFSGEGDEASATCAECLHDTWALEMGEQPPRWVQLHADGGPLGAIGRRNGSWALDVANHRLLVWGGTADGRTAFPGLYALDLDRGHEVWREVPTVGDAPVRASGAMVYDAARRRMLVGFGNAGQVYVDLWSLALE